MAKPDKDVLLAALNSAAAAHHDYQSNYLDGQHNAQWPGWYAAYVLGRVGDFAAASDLAAWLDAVNGEDWSDAAAEAVLARLD